jgi:PRTRC genetic system protein B
MEYLNDIEYVLDSALFFYRGAKNNELINFATPDFYYIEERKIGIDATTGKPCYLAGKPISEKAVNDYLEIMQNKANYRKGNLGLIPKNVLSINQTGGILWKCPANKRTIKTVQRFHNIDGIASYPHLIFAYNDSKLRVYAVKTLKIENNTDLYISPFWNVYNDGSVCMGSASLKGVEKKSYDSLQEKIDDIETIFFNSPYSHHLGHSAQALKNNSLDQQWKDLIENPKKRFPTNELKKMPSYPKTINDLMNMENF